MHMQLKAHKEKRAQKNYRQTKLNTKKKTELAEIMCTCVCVWS